MSPFYALAPIILAILGPQHGCSYLRDWMDSAIDGVKSHTPRNCVAVNNVPAGSGDGRFALCLVNLNEDKTDTKNDELDWTAEALANFISSRSAELLLAGGDILSIFGRVEYWLGLAWGTLAGLATAWMIGRCCGSRRSGGGGESRNVYYPAEEKRVEVSIGEQTIDGNDVVISVETPATESTSAESATPRVMVDNVKEAAEAYRRELPDVRFNAPVYRGKVKDLSQ